MEKLKIMTVVLAASMLTGCTSYSTNSRSSIDADSIYNFDGGIWAGQNYNEDINSYYYYDDDTDNWTTYYGEFTEDEDQYYVNDVPEYVDDFKDSAAYEAAYQNYIDRQSYDNDDWDSGSSWDSSDSWDSGSTDWSSDW